MDEEMNARIVELDGTQYEAIISYMEDIYAGVESLHTSVLHYGVFVVLLTVFAFYGLLRRAGKKGGVK